MELRALFLLFGNVLCGCNSMVYFVALKKIINSLQCNIFTLYKLFKHCLAGLLSD